MSLNADQLLDRMKLKSELARWRVLTLLFVGLSLFLILENFIPDRNTSSVSLTSESVMRIRLEGILFENHEREAKLKKLASNPRVKAVIAHINSPGGTIVGGETLYESLRHIAKEKPLVVVMGSVAASGGYMAALPAHHIIARQGTLTGSIGVMLQSAELSKLSQKLGVDFVTFKSGNLKGVPSPFESVSPKANAVIQSTIDDSFNMFLDMVTEHRELSKKTINTLADGRVFTGRQAVKIGLVDAIGGEEDARLWLEEKHQISRSMKVQDYSIDPELTPFEKLLKTTIGESFERFGAIDSLKHGMMALYQLPALQ